MIIVISAEMSKNSQTVIKKTKIVELQRDQRKTSVIILKRKCVSYVDSLSSLPSGLIIQENELIDYKGAKIVINIFL